MAGSAVERSAEAIAEMAARPNAAAVVTQARAVVTAMAAAEAIGCGLGWRRGAEAIGVRLEWRRCAMAAAEATAAVVVATE